MKSIKINGSKRESVGKSSAKVLRNAGKVPCVVYGGEKPVHFSADEISFSKLVYTPNAHTVAISFDGKSEITSNDLEVLARFIKLFPSSNSASYLIAFKRDLISSFL